MRALIKKDLFVLIRQMRMFLVIIVVFAILPGNSMTVFAVVYTAMLPYTALAYDERSKWDQMAAMLPYTNGDIVLSKYLLGYLLMGCAALLSLAAKLITRSDPSGMLLGLCIGLLMMALTLPPMFRFGVEKGRMFFVFLMVLLGVGGTSLVTGITESPNTGSMEHLLMLILPLAAVVLNLVSIPLSIVLYGRRDR